MASGRLIDYLGSGTAASRPASPTLISGSLGLYYATDTAAFSVWDGTSWHDNTSSSSGVIQQNSQSAAYTLVAGDAGKHILHPSADTTARTFTIPANSSVAFAIGTAVTFVNQNSAGTLTIAIIPGRQAFISNGGKEPRSALESRRVSLGAHWVDSRESSLLRRLERGREIGL